MLLIISIGSLQLTAGNSGILLSGWIGVVVLDAVLDVVLWLLKWIVRVLVYRLHLSWIRLLRKLQTIIKCRCSELVAQAEAQLRMDVSATSYGSRQH